MFRSSLELELLAQVKMDELNVIRQDNQRCLAASKTVSSFGSMRRRLGLTLIGAGTRLAGVELPSAATPAVAGR